MKTSKNAFTMIELIFVIVILGILASVAIPRLMVTRNDAVISKLANNVMTSVSEMSSYALSQGNSESNFSVMSNSMFEMEINHDAVLSNNKAEIKAGEIADCVIFSVDNNITTGVASLNITFTDTNGDRLCLSLQNAIGSTNYSMKLKGTNVEY